LFVSFLGMLRNKFFPMAPEILADQEVSIEYVSPMALAQRGQELQSLMRGMEIFGGLSQALPVMDYIDENGLVKNIIRVLLQTEKLNITKASLDTLASILGGL